MRKTPGKTPRREQPDHAVPRLGSNLAGAVLDPLDIDWNARLLELRRRLHEVMFGWGMAANSAPESDAATIMSSVAVVLAALHHSVEQADIALFRDDKRDTDAVKERGEQALDQLRKIEHAVRKAVRLSERFERAEQMRHLEAIVAAHLAPRRGQPLSHRDLIQLSQGFVQHVWGGRSMPVARQLTRKRLLLDPFDEGRARAVLDAFERVPPDRRNHHDAQRFIRAGLAALGFKDAKGKPPRGLFDFSIKEDERKAPPGE